MGNASILRPLLEEEEVWSRISFMEEDRRGGLTASLVGGEVGEEGMSIPTTRAPEGAVGPPGGEVWVCL